MQASAAGPSDRLLRSLGRRLSSLPAVTEAVVIRDARSLLVRYDASRCTLDCMMRQVRGAVGACHGAAADGPYAPPAPIVSSTRESRAAVAVLHSIPGRIRLRVPRLRRGARAVEHLQNGLAAENGIRRVEALPEVESLIVEYDSDAHRPQGLVRRIEELLRRGRSAPPVGEDQPLRAQDVAPPRRGGLHPLVIPSIAMALAATEALPAVLVGAALAAAAAPIARRAVEGLRRRRFNVDQLDVAALTVLAAQGNFLIGGMVAWLVGLGDYILEQTAGRSRRAISELMSPENQRAWVERDGRVVSVPVSELAPGDTALVYPGDLLPADGVVTHGKALVDQKALTGEPEAVLKEPGERVYALSAVVDGHLRVRVEHIGRETRAGRIVELIENAPLSDTRIQNYAALIGDRLVGPIFALAAAVYLLTGDPLRAAAVLILEFVTGIRVSAPATILSAMAGAARHGLFIKGGKAIEKLAKVDAIVFDKTGTLTQGAPVVTAIHALTPDLTPDELLRLAACAEANLKHPSARAVVEAAEARGLAVSAPRSMEYVLGQGVRARVQCGEGAQTWDIAAGSARFMANLGVDARAAERFAPEHRAAGRSLIYVAGAGRLLGLIAYADAPREESEAVIHALRHRGVRRVVMLTGDNARAAQAVAARLGITDVVSDAFPEQKAEVIRQLRQEGRTVAVIGDGINDAAAFAEADVAISLSHGAEVARETADVILLEGDLTRLPEAVDLAREAMGILRQNVNIVVAPNAVALAAAVFGIASPLISTLLNNGTTIVAGLNALRPLYRRPSPRVERPLIAAPESDAVREAA